MARWNHLEQLEQTGQIALQPPPARSRPEAFVRAGAMRVNGSRARQLNQFTDTNTLLYMARTVG